MEFRDLKAQYDKYKNEIDSSILRVLNSTNFIGGKEVTEFEDRLKDYVGVKHCISCANGTDALSLVLNAWGIKAGDAVFVPDFTFFATAEVASFAGATPIFVDVELDSFNICVISLEKEIKRVIRDNTLKPRVIIPVDLFGLPANYEEIEKLAKKYNLLILEDGAQGFGGEFKGKKACSFGDAAITSFFPAKPLGCYGDGGAIFTNDDALANLISSLKVHGKGEDKYDNVRIGVNSRLDTIQAAILNVKLDAFIEHELRSVNRVHALYNSLLDGVVTTPKIKKEYYSSFAQYTIRLNSKEERDNLQSRLKDLGIPTMVYYIKPMHKQTAFKDILVIEESLKNSSLLSDTVLSLPMHPYLKEEEIIFIADKIKEVLKK